MKNWEEKFIDKMIAPLCEEYDKIKGANTNLARIAPDFIDGLKPVQRRALYIMYLKDQGKTFRKLATISGDVFGRVHPHSPVAIEDTIVGMEQEWVNNLPLIEGNGNFGSVAGDVAGASRYIKARLSEYAQACYFEDWKDSVVDTVAAYNEEDVEPVYLPAKYPNVLINGCLGIGYGMSSNIPPYNFKEVLEACIKIILNPNAPIVLIPDSPSGADIIEGDFARLSNNGCGVYSMRCKYVIDAEKNAITITHLPYQVTSRKITDRIAAIKMENGLPELINMGDLSGKEINIQLEIRDDVNPYKFMRKLINEVDGLEKSYPVNITVTNDYQSFDYSIKKLLTEWINWRREQKRTVISHKHTTLLAEQRTNDVKIFLMSKNNLEDTIKIFRTSRNRAEIEQRLIEKYRHSDIRMDSLQARTLSNMRLVELSSDSYDACIKRREELYKEIKEVEDILQMENGVDKIIIAELRDGIKRFGTPRKSNVVPAKISISNTVEGACILQLSADGNILRKECSNVDEEPVPVDSNGFAVKVDNDSSFILIDDKGYHSFIRVRELPLDTEVPVNRYSKQTLDGNIVAMLPLDIDIDRYCTLISRKGQLKRIRIAEMKPSKKPCIDIDKDDKLVRGIVTLNKTDKDVLIYTKNGMGQRLDPSTIRVTSPNARGTNGFKLRGDDEIIGCYLINPIENQYLLYVTMKGKMRLNGIQYLEARNSKHDAMVSLITLNDRDKLVSIVGCNNNQKAQVFYDDGSTEVVDLTKMEETTMSSEPKKMVSANMVTHNIVKVKII